MVQFLTCLHGHRWQVPDAYAGSVLGLATVCPVCGARAETMVQDLDPPSSSSAPPDELPPPPRPLVPRTALEPPPHPEIPQLPPEGGTFPRIPGYELLGELGRGGMGVVYQARQVKLNRQVALKMVLAGHLDSLVAVQRFQAEAEAVANLDHPHIVPVYEVGAYQDQHYFSMKLVQGTSLARRMEEFRREPRSAARLLAVVARAVHHVHQRGILHRDLKPGNILLDQHDEPNVTDFGLSKHIEGDAGLTQTGAIIGTPSYMAPEQAFGRKDLSTAVDVYSLGAILYELLTGQPPFRGDTPVETLLQVREQEPVRPRLLDPRADRDLETVCLKCLEKESARRYGSAEALAEDLERWLAGEPVQARRSSAWERGVKWMKRRPAAAALLGVSVLAVAAMAAGLAGLFYGHRVRDLNNRLEAALQDAGEQRDEANRQHVRAEGLRASIQYARDMNLAQRAWDVPQLDRVVEILKAHQQADGGKDRRGFEWHYLWSLCHGERLNLQGHQSIVMAVAFSPDGRRLASASWDKTVKIWDTQTGRELLTLKGHTVQLNAVAFSPDGRRLASAGGWTNRPGEVKLWEAETGKELLALKGHTDSVHSVTYSPDGRRLASASWDRTMRVWDAATGKELFTYQGHRGQVHWVRFSPDGQLIASAGPGDVKLLEATTGKELHTFSASRFAAFSPDGQRLAALAWDASTNIPSLNLWDVRTGNQLLACRGDIGATESLAFSPNGQLLLSAGWDGTIKFWDAQSGTELHALKAHSGVVWGLAFSPDGRHFASAAGDKVVKVWDTNTSQEPLMVRARLNGQCLVYSSDGLHLASSGLEGTVKILEAATGKPVRTLTGHTVETEAGGQRNVRWSEVTGLAYSPDGRRIASSSKDKTVKVWETATGKELLTFRGHADEVNCVAFSPDGRRIASGSKVSDKLEEEAGEIKIWDVDTGQELLCLRGPNQAVEPGYTQAVSWVMFSPDGERLAAAGYHHAVKVWDLATGKEVFTLKGAVLPVFGPDGRRLAAATDYLGRSVTIWDAMSGQELVSLKGHTGTVGGVAFSKDGRRLATAGDATVKVWDAETGQELLSLRGHAGPVWSVAFSPDGRRIASIGKDQVLRVWGLSARGQGWGIWGTAGLGDDHGPDQVAQAVQELGGSTERNQKVPQRPVIGMTLNDLPLTDADLKPLTALQDLNALNLENTRVTGAGLKVLAPLVQLRILSLKGSPVTDNGLKGLASLAQLESLDLGETQVTDAGLKELAALKRLRWLKLERTKVTEAGAAEVAKGLPGCRISR